MLIGERTRSVVRRAFIHASSLHAYASSGWTIDAVPGDCSIFAANGSVLTRSAPSRVEDLELVERARRAMSGMKSSHTPELPSMRIGKMRPSQAQKSPTTLTRRAFGAHTAKLTPCDAVDRPRMRAELLPELAMRAFVEEMKVDVAERREKAVWVAALPGCAVRDSESASDSRSGSVAPAMKTLRRDPTWPLRFPRHRHDAAVVEHAFARRSRSGSARERRRRSRRPTVAGCAPRIACGTRVLAGQQAIEIVARADDRRHPARRRRGRDDRRHASSSRRARLGGFLRQPCGSAERTRSSSCRASPRLVMRRFSP